MARRELLRSILDAAKLIQVACMNIEMHVNAVVEPNAQLLFELSESIHARLSELDDAFTVLENEAEGK